MAQLQPPCSPSSSEPPSFSVGRTFDAYSLTSGRRWGWLERTVVLYCPSAVFLVLILSLLWKICILSHTGLWEQVQKPQVQLEILAGVIVILQYLQFFSCRWRFQWNHRLFQLAAWAAYHVPVILPAFAMGLMLQFVCPYWLVAIFFAAGYSDSMAAYSLQDDKQDVRGFARRAMSLGYLLVALRQLQEAGLAPAEMLSLLLGFLVFLADLIVSSWARIRSVDLCTMAADRSRLPGRAKSTILEDEFEQAGRIVIAAVSAGCTTYQDIQDLPCLSSVKDICLSSALFIQLLQRYERIEVDLSSAHAARAFFKKKLFIAQEHAATKAFKLVEVQLAFLYDHFFSSLGSPSRTSHRLYMVYSYLKTSFLLSVFLLAYYYYPVDDEYEQSELMNTFYPSLIALILLEISQFVRYFSSNWLKVSYMCAWARRTWYIRFIPFWLPIQEAGKEEHVWQNKLGQCSLVEGFRRSSKLPGWRPRGTTTPSTPVALHDDEGALKRWIFQKTVCSNPGAFAFDVSSQSRMMESKSHDELSWTLSQGSEVRIILIWHVATWYCERAEEDATSQGGEDVIVATQLSRYCVYLVVFHPELIPWSQADATRKVCCKAMEELEDNLRGKTPMDLHKMMGIWDDVDDQGILKLGSKLGRQLMGMQSDRWNIMADFWTQMIMSMAQWGKKRAHIEHLAKGGEFVTHLWALLSNAGIEQERTFIKENNNDGEKSKQGSTMKVKGTHVD